MPNRSCECWDFVAWSLALFYGGSCAILAGFSGRIFRQGVLQGCMVQYAKYDVVNATNRDVWGCSIDVAFVAYELSLS